MTTTTIQIPLPGDEYDGRTVVASCWIRDDEIILALVMLLNAEAPYYSVAQIEWRPVPGLPYWHNNGETFHRNINEATAEYANSGGDI